MAVLISQIEKLIEKRRSSLSYKTDVLHFMACHVGYPGVEACSCVTLHCWIFLDEILDERKVRQHDKSDNCP